MQDFAGRVAVVTGAGSGIGRAYAEALAGLDMHLVLADIDPASLDGAAVALPGARSITTTAVDVSDAAAVEALAALAYDRHGAVHLLCNNAGVSVTRRILDATVEDWQWLLGVNLWGVIHGVRAFVPRMIAGGDEGHVVNTASIASWLVVPSYGVYAASKHAVAAITDALAAELTADGARIGVTAVCPSLVRTRLFSSERNRPEVLAGSGFDDTEQRRVDDITEGIQTPADVAATMIDAVRAGELWAFPNRERLDLVRDRYATILS